MFEVSELIYQILSSNTALAAAVGNSIYPLVADQDQELPFVVYSVGEQPTYSKNGQNDYTIQIVAYHENYNDALAVSNLIKDAIFGAAEVFRYISGSPELTAEYLISVKLNYNYKK